MRVNDRNLPGTSAAETGRAQELQQTDQHGTKSTGSGKADGSSDRVEFSGTLGRLSRAMSAFDSDRGSRVQTLSAQYQSGNYQANSAATSRGIISEALGAGTK
jgi:hypothetical protein